jgi:uncharacterized protein YbjT (DUF2867 family)
MKNNILVIGGTGKTGRKVAQRLTNLGHNVRIGSRSASPAFDWHQPDGWADVLQNIDQMYVTFQPDLAVPGAAKAIEQLVYLAIDAGVKKMVLLSGKGETEAENCERIVIGSGIDYTIIRATWFNQNFSESFFLDPILAGHVTLPKPEARVPYVDTDDIADVAVEVLLDEKHNGKIYQLTGPRLLTFADVVEEISEVTGRDIQFTPVSMDDYVNTLKQHGLPDDYVWLINYLFTEVLGRNGNDEISGDIEQILGRKPKDFSEFARQNAQTWVVEDSIVE